MPKTFKQSQSSKRRTPKFIYGAAIGLFIGALTVALGPNVAVYSLVGLLVIAGYIFFLQRQRVAGSQWTPRPLAAKPLVGALMIGVIAVGGVQYLGVSFAWHPQGKIIKTVQNMTTPSQIVDANTAATALPAKTGDILTYSIVVKNEAADASKSYNDMAFTVMTDTLPAGVELVSNPATRTITENMGTILPGKSVTKTYQVKVVSTTGGALVENKACFTADSVVKDNPQKGCDVAITTVTPPTTPPPTPPTPTPPTPTPPTPTPPTPTPPTPTPPTPTPPTPTPPTPTPTPPTPTPTTPTPPPTTVTIAPTPPPTTTVSTEELPNAGPRNVIIIGLFTVIAGYLFSAVYGLWSNNRVKRFSAR